MLDNASDLLQMANKALKEGNNSKAAALYDRFIASYPNHPQISIAQTNFAYSISLLTAPTEIPSYDSRSEPETCVLNSPIKSLCFATEEIENCPNDPEAFASRAKIFEQMNQYRNATCDYQRAQRRNPSKLEYMRNVSISALYCNELESAMTASRISVSGGVCCFLPQAQLMWCAHRYDEAMRLLNTAVLNEEENSLLTRGKINFALGRIEEADNDFQCSDAPACYRFVCQLLIDCKIPQMPSYHTREGMILHELFNGLLKYNVKACITPLDLDIPLQVQRIWITPSPSTKELLLAASTLTTQYIKSEEAKNEACDDLVIDMRMSNLAIQVGKTVLIHSPSARQSAAIGFAAIEIRQLLRTHVATCLPISLDNAVSNVANWIRLIDPMTPIFWRRKLPGSIQPAFIQRGSFHTEIVMIYLRVFQVLKEQLLLSNNDDDDRIKNAQSTEELWNVLRNDVTVLCGTSDAEIFLRMAQNSCIEFGFVVQNTPEHWSKSMPNVFVAWSDALLSIGRPNSQIDGIRASFKFLYEWMRAWPLTSESHTVGAVLFYSLFNASTGTNLTESLPSPIMLQIEALLAPGFQEFFNLVARHFRSSLKKGSIDEDIPDLQEMLPTFCSRLSALRDIQIMNTAAQEPEEVKIKESGNDLFYEIQKSMDAEAMVPSSTSDNEEEEGEEEEIDQKASV